MDHRCTCEMTELLENISKSSWPEVKQRGLRYDSKNTIHKRQNK
jgi:hypothetical protein